MTRIEYVYVARKPGDARRYASPIPWSSEFLAVLRGDGFRIYRLTYEADDDFDAERAASCTPTGGLT